MPCPPSCSSALTSTRDARSAGTIPMSSPGRAADRRGVQEHAPVVVEVEVQRDVAADVDRAEEQARRPARQQQAGRRAREREQQAFGEEQPDRAAPGRDPRAARIAISRCRTVPRTSSRFATFMHAISSTSVASPSIDPRSAAPATTGTASAPDAPGGSGITRAVTSFSCGIRPLQPLRDDVHRGLRGRRR